MNIGLIGLGTVGSGVVKTLKNFSQVSIKKIAVKNLTKKRNIENLDETLLTDNPFEIVNSENIDVVVEVIGGVEPAFELLKTAIRNKKHVVAANKELLAKHGRELFALANENNVVILYEAAIGGGIPIIMPIKTALRANKISKIMAILNGTTNYILTKMDEEDADYTDVLKEAQNLGYAETDPTGDVEGFDAAYKITTLAAIAFNERVDINKVYKEGITDITAKDMEYARELGYKIKLIALAQKDEQGHLDVRVHPMMIDKDSALAQVNNVTNAVMLKGFPVGEVMFTGAGAGEFPTASAVVGDILALETDLKANPSKPLPMLRCEHSLNLAENAVQIDISDTYNKYYISLSVANTPGVIGLVGMICGKHKINLQSLLQKGVNNAEFAEVIVVTENSKEFDVRNAIDEMQKEQSIKHVNNLIRVID